MYVCMYYVQYMQNAVILNGAIAVVVFTSVNKKDSRLSITSSNDRAVLITGGFDILLFKISIIFFQIHAILKHYYMEVADF